MVSVDVKPYVSAPLYPMSKDPNLRLSRSLRRWTSVPFSTIRSHLYLFLTCEGWGTTGDFKISFFHFSLLSCALWDLANSRPVHSLMLSSHLFFCLPCLLPSFTVPCKMVLARPDDPETRPYHCSLRLFTPVKRSSCSPIACWLLAHIYSSVTWFLDETRSNMR